MDTKVTSSRFRLSLNDFWKGFLMAVGSPVIAIIIASLNAGELTVNWKQVATVGLAAGLMYLSKNFFDKPKVVITDQESVAAVKNGTATVELRST
jgi:hypothetical protein